MVLCIRAYQATKPFRPAKCRFYPTCSEYAAQAIVKHGAAKGLLMSCVRLAKCHPFHPGGVDELPDAHNHENHTDYNKGAALPVRSLVPAHLGAGTQPRCGGPVNP